MKKLIAKIILTLGLILILTPSAKPQEELDSLFIIGKDILELFGQMTELTDEQEIDYGDRIAAQFNQQVTITSQDQSKVERIGNKISGYVTRSVIPYKFRVIETDEVNAFSMAGGNIWVTTGLLNTVETDDELAFVIAHEISHEDKKHNMRRVQILFRAKEFGGEEAEYFTMIAQNLATMPFAKYQEFEADEWGAYLMHKAGYDTKGALDFFEKLSKLGSDEGEKDLGYIFRTHPFTKDRISNLKKYIKNNL
ncbi:MAG: M48 family metallopeptidase [Ignavibacteria bacterium]|nr:M48 family metallopeptidase [Ignavibacteria bacterium]